MSGQLTPAKRQNDRNESNIRGKWQKTSAFNSQNLRIPPGTSFFRVLCPASKGGSVIGKGGGIISQIRQETGAKVRVEETVPGCDERIIVIIESDKENGVDAEQSKGEEEKNDTDKVDNLDEQEKEEKEGEDKESVDTIDKDLVLPKIHNVRRDHLLLRRLCYLFSKELLKENPKQLVKMKRMIRLPHFL